MARQRVWDVSALVRPIHYLPLKSSPCNLANISSRYDLNPAHANSRRGSSSANRSSLPPPLVVEGAESDAAHANSRNRLSRIFDVNRLRQATVEEQMDALRRMREETNESRRQEHSSPEDDDGEAARGQSARFAAKLKERFRIRTRAQAAEDRDREA